MSKVVRFNDEQEDALVEAICQAIDLEVGEVEKIEDVHIRYLGALIQIRDKLTGGSNGTDTK